MTHLDYLAACLTGTSTVLLAFRRRAGFLLLAAGVTVWVAVALLSRYEGRPIYGMLLANLWTLGWAVVGWRRWGR